MQTSQDEADRLCGHFEELKAMVDSFEQLKAETPEKFYAEMELFMQRVAVAECVAHGNRALPNLDKVEQCVHRVMNTLFEQADKLDPHAHLHARFSGPAVAYCAARWVNELEDRLIDKEKAKKDADVPLIEVPKMKLS